MRVQTHYEQTGRRMPVPVVEFPVMDSHGAQWLRVSMTQLEDIERAVAAAKTALRAATKKRKGGK